MWLHLPSECCPSSPESGDSISLSVWPSRRLASCAMSRGRRMRPRYWRAAWKRETWIRLLSGVTSRPSTARRGVALWISSWAGRPAKTSVSPESEPGSKGPAAPFSVTSSEWFARLSPDGCSWKTSEDCSLLPGILSDSSSVSWPVSGSMRSGRCFRRPRVALRTGESGSSSWPTAQSRDGKGASDQVQDRGTRGAPLNEIAKLWPTSTARDSRGSGSRSLPGSNAHEGTSLTDAAVRDPKWPTPQAQTPNALRSAGRPERCDDPRRTTNLQDRVAAWPTPRTITGGAESAKRKQELGRTESGGGDLQSASALFSLPAPETPPDGEPSSSGGRGSRRQYPTPSAIPYGTNRGGSMGRVGPERPSLEYQVKAKGKRLNPLFVEWMMCWPTGWTGFGPVEMESWLSKARRRLSRLLGGSKNASQ